MKASIEKELQIETSNQSGTASKLTTLISGQAKTNIKVLMGRVVDGKGRFSIITDNNSKLLDTLKSSELFKNIKEQDVLVVKTKNTVDDCTTVTSKIASAGIDINYMFTTNFDNSPSIVLSTNNNRDALKLFS